MFRGLIKSAFKFAKTKEFIKVTPTALNRLKQLMTRKNNQKIIGVKVSLTKRGCNGLSYSMNYVQKPQKFDQVIQQKDIKIIIDSKALMALVGTEMDYVTTQTSEEFVFKNPNEKGKCGCGESVHF